MMKADTKACLAVISLTYAATAWLGLQNFLLKKKQKYLEILQKR